MTASARSGLLTPLFVLGTLAALLYQLSGLEVSLGTAAAIPELVAQANERLGLLPAVLPGSRRLSRWPLAFVQSLAGAPPPSLPNHDGRVELARSVEALKYSTLSVDDHMHWPLTAVASLAVALADVACGAKLLGHVNQLVIKDTGSAVRMVPVCRPFSQPAAID